MRRWIGSAHAVSFSLVLVGQTDTVLAQDHQIVDTDHVRVRVETIATGLHHPWGIALLPDGRTVELLTRGLAEPGT